MLGTLLAFVAVSAVVTCTPGQDTALTIRNTLARGRRGLLLAAARLALAVRSRGSHCAALPLTGVVLVGFGIRLATER